MKLKFLNILLKKFIFQKKLRTQKNWEHEFIQIFVQIQERTYFAYLGYFGALALIVISNETNDFPL